MIWQDSPSTATPINAANLNVLQQRGGAGVNVWETEGNPAAVTDWGAVVNNLVANGARNLFFRRVSGANTVYPCTTPIAPWLTAGVREPVVFRGETGHVWQEFVNGVFVKPSVCLRWTGANGESLIRRQGTQTFQAYDLGLEFTNGYTGRLIRAAPDDGGISTDAAYGGLFVRCWIGPSSPGVSGEDSADCLVSLIRDVESKYLHTSIYGGQYLVRGLEDNGVSFANDAEWIGCQFFNPAKAAFCNVGLNWRVIGGVFEFTDPIGADTGADGLLDSTFVFPQGSIEFLFPTFWDITNPTFKLFSSVSGRPIDIKVVGGYAHQGADNIELLGGGSLDVDGLRINSGNMALNLGSATTDHKRVTLRNIHLPNTKRVIWTNRDGHDVTVDNAASVNSRSTNIRQAAIETTGVVFSDAGAEAPTLGNFAANVSGGVINSSSDPVALIYITTSGVIAAGTKIADLTFNVPLPYNKLGSLSGGSIPVPHIEPLGFNEATSGVTTNATDSRVAGVTGKATQNDRAKVELVTANGIPSGKTLGFAISMKVFG